jgi:hypothetical protein
MMEKGSSWPAHVVEDGCDDPAGLGGRVVLAVSVMAAGRGRPAGISFAELGYPLMIAINAAVKGAGSRSPRIASCWL